MDGIVRFRVVPMVLPKNSHLYEVADNSSAVKSKLVPLQTAVLPSIEIEGPTFNENFVITSLTPSFTLT